MKKIELKGFRKALENKEAELRNRARNREALAIETSPDELDRIQSANDRDSATENMERAFSRLREVQAALRRMGEGTFGVCAGCEGDINPRRLAAVPWARYCIVCQVAAGREPKTPWSEIETSLALAG